METKVKELLDKLLDNMNELSRYVTGGDEFVAVDDIFRAIHEARKVFERKDVFEK